MDLLKLPHRAEAILQGAPAWQQAWRGSPLIKVFDVTGFRIIVVPLEFLVRGQIQDGWRHIYELIGFCVEFNNGRLYSPGPYGLTPIDESGWPVPGDYIFTTFIQYPGEVMPRCGPCQPLVGPHGKQVGRQPQRIDQTTMSASSRTSRAGQSKFKTQLCMRDGVCLATGKNNYDNMGAHIVPVSRPDLYIMILGNEGASSLYLQSMGLLLSPDSHKSFDALQWAFWPRETDMVLHVFAIDNPAIASLHGRVVPYSFFRVENHLDWPDPRLLRFQYQQCVQMFLRFYSYGISAQDAVRQMTGQSI